jgi:membrane peptidoglycan carboxypeptidase
VAPVLLSLEREALSFNDALEALAGALVAIEEQPFADHAAISCGAG